MSMNREKYCLFIYTGLTVDMAVMFMKCEGQMQGIAYLCVYVSAPVCVCVSACVYMCLCVYVYARVYVCVCLSACVNGRARGYVRGVAIK